MQAKDYDCLIGGVIQSLNRNNNNNKKICFAIPYCKDCFCRGVCVGVKDKEKC